MKSEIPVDQAAACARAPRASPRTAPTVTMHHKVNEIEGIARLNSERARPHHPHRPEHACGSTTPAARFHRASRLPPLSHRTCGV